MRPSARFASSSRGLVLTAVSLLLSFCALPSSGMQRSTSGGSGDGGLIRGDLPGSIQSRIYPAAARVPAFPMEDDRLRKPKNWPNAMTIGGVRCVLRIHAWESGEGLALKSLKDLGPRMRLMLFYGQENSRWDSGIAGWGPRYTWNERKELIERIWYEPDSSRLVTHDYTYYRSGRLLGYSWRREPRNPAVESYEFLSQFYDQGGRLIAIGYEKTNKGTHESLYAWMGAEVPYDDFRMKTHVLYSSAHPGNR